MASAAAWLTVRSFTQRETGVLLDEDRQYLLESRLAPLASRMGFASVDDYVRVACAPGSAHRHRQAVLDAMTTHETSFFRDPIFWQHLEQAALPALLRQSGGRALSVWSAASATGQEAYSFAMTLREHDRELCARSTILATDVSEACVERGREGVYNSLEINRGLSAGRLLHHFDQVAGGYRVKAHLGQRVTWRAESLLGATPYPRGLDVIMCRNVLIYFSEADRARVIAELARSVAPWGIIGLGTSEVVGGLAPIGDGWYTPRARS